MWKVEILSAVKVARLRSLCCFRTKHYWWHYFENEWDWKQEDKICSNCARLMWRRFSDEVVYDAMMKGSGLVGMQMASCRYIFDKIWSNYLQWMICSDLRVIQHSCRKLAIIYFFISLEHIKSNEFCRYVAQSRKTFELFTIVLLLDKIARWTTTSKTLVKYWVR